ncbi:MAG: ROK family transcriptional regulator [Candidatus Kaistia colombiensis]|nr:MAG: ROK family transcriptional regulator [Kaistia sp.]
MIEDRLKSLLDDPADGTPSARIVRLLSERGTLSATEIARLTGLAKSTVSMTLAGLRRSDIVIESGHGDTVRGAGVGRPATALTLNPKVGTCVGVLFGLEAIQLIVADVSHRVISDRKVQIEPDYSPAEAAALTRRLIDEAYEEHGLAPEGRLGVGVAVAGPINPIDGKVLRASGVPTWAGTDIRAAFGPVLQSPIFADNESNCAAIAEMMWGAAIGAEDFIFFKIDLGVGGAIVNRGRVITGIAGGAGEFGHMIIDPAGPLCRCGNRGCLELYASARDAVAQSERRLGRPVDIDGLVALARGGDADSRSRIVAMAEAAGKGLAIIGTALNPGLVVLGGQLSRAGEMLLGPLSESFERHTLVKRADIAPEARTRFVTGVFTDNDACLGAVGLVLRHHGRLG